MINYLVSIKKIIMDDNTEFYSFMFILYAWFLYSIIAFTILYINKELIILVIASSLGLIYVSYLVISDSNYGHIIEEKLDNLKIRLDNFKENVLIFTKKNEKKDDDENEILLNEYVKIEEG